MRLLQDLWATSRRRAFTMAALIGLGAAGQAAAAALAGPVLLHRAWWLFALLAAGLGVAACGNLVVDLLAARLTADWSAKVRSELCRVAMGQPLTRLEVTPVGELLDRIDGDVYQVSSVLRGQGVRLAQSGAVGALSLIVSTFVWWPAGLVMGLVSAGLIWRLRKPVSAIAPARATEEEAWSDLAAVVEESIYGQDDIRTSLARPYVLKLFAQRSKMVLQLGRRVWKMSAGVTFVAAMVTRTAIAGVVVAGAVALAAGAVDGARLTAIWLLALAFGGTVEQLSRMVPELQNAFGAWTRITQLREAEQEPAGGAAPAGGDLVISDLTFSYGNAERPQPALAEVSLTFSPGASYALIGRTGSGKSTLAKVLTRAVEVPRGKVSLAGQDLLDLDLELLRRMVALVPQRTDILAGTLAENIALFDPDLLAAADRAIDELGLRAWVNELPAGMQTRIGDGGHTLSAGQEQLVAFARILVRDPQVVILDEATARLDPVTELQVQRATDRLLRGRIGVVVAHRLSSVRRCDQVVVLADGRVAESGPLRESERFAQLLAVSEAATATGFGLTADAASSAAGAASGSGRLTDVSVNAATAGSRSGVATLPDQAPGSNATDQAMGRHAPEEPIDKHTPETANGKHTPEQANGKHGPEPANGEQVARKAAQPPTGERLPPDTVDIGNRLEKVPPPPLPPAPPARTFRQIARMALNDPRYGLTALLLFFTHVIIGLDGSALPWLWADLVDGGDVLWPAVGIVAALLLGAPSAYYTGRWFPEWWVRQMLRISLRLVYGQTGPRRRSAHTSGEVVAQSGDTERVVVLADNLIDQSACLVTLIAMTWISGSFVPALFFAGTMLVSGIAASSFGPALAKSAHRTVAARAAFATALTSSLSAARTVKLAGATEAVLAYLARLENTRSTMYRREISVSVWSRSTPSVLSGLLPIAAWAMYLHGALTAGAVLVVVSTLGAARWFAWTTASLIANLPSARVWTKRTVAMAGVSDYTAAVPGVDISAGTAPSPPMAPRKPLERLELDGFTAVHEDGSVAAQNVDLTVRRGELVLIVGPVGSGKSSLLRALAGIVHHTGTLRWNGEVVTEPEMFLRPNQVGYVAQLPRVLSGSVADNIRLGFELDPAPAVTTAQLDHDLNAAGSGLGLLIGHKGTRLSGGQLQRLALARALAPATELLIADDVSSALDVTTELELWRALREHGVTVIGSTSKKAALLQADRVVVLLGGKVTAQGRWRDLESDWRHLAG